MDHIYKLKFLSGTLTGVEFSLPPGDTVFNVGAPGRMRELGMAETLVGADNVFYVADDHRTGRFVAFVGPVGETGRRDVTLREYIGTEWRLVPLSLNRVVHVLGLAIAIGREDVQWSEDVQHYAAGSVALGSRGTTQGVARPALRRPAILLAAVFVAILAVVGGQWWLQRTEARVAAMEQVLSAAPHQFQVAAGRDGRMYAFADGDAAVAWARRALLRSGRGSDVVIERRAEAERLGAVLENAGLAHVVVRMRTTRRPGVVLVSTVQGDSGRHTLASTLVRDEAPYAEQVEVSSVADGQLIDIAREELRARGISTRIDRRGSRSSIINDAFLDDASLHLMARYRDAFIDRWGARRVQISIRLWDDLLKGRSFQYSHDQLLSVGQGRWEFSTRTSP